MNFTQDQYFERQQYHNRTIVELNGAGAGLSTGSNNRVLTFAGGSAAASALGSVDGGVTIVQGHRQNSENVGRLGKILFVKESTCTANMAYYSISVKRPYY